MVNDPHILFRYECKKRRIAISYWRKYCISRKEFFYINQRSFFRPRSVQFCRFYLKSILWLGPFKRKTSERSRECVYFVPSIENQRKKQRMWIFCPQVYIHICVHTNFPLSEVKGTSARDPKAVLFKETKKLKTFAECSQYLLKLNEMVKWEKIDCFELILCGWPIKSWMVKKTKPQISCMFRFLKAV